jgi:hypothetical protein
MARGLQPLRKRSADVWQRLGRIGQHLAHAQHCGRSDRWLREGGHRWGGTRNGKPMANSPIAIPGSSKTRALVEFWGQLNGATLACIEFVRRNIQILEDISYHKFHNQNSDLNNDLFLMSGAVHRFQLCICPELEAYTAAETAKESAVFKERRKARKERVPPSLKGAKGGKSGEK